MTRWVWIGSNAKKGKRRSEIRTCECDCGEEEKLMAEERTPIWERGFGAQGFRKKKPGESFSIRVSLILAVSFEFTLAVELSLTYRDD